MVGCLSSSSEANCYYLGDRHSACVSISWLRHATELILWATKARKGKKHYTFNYEEMKAENGDKQMKNVWRMSAPGKNEKLYGKHPTQKPVALVARCL